MSNELNLLPIFNNDLPWKVYAIKALIKSNNKTINEDENCPVLSLTINGVKEKKNLNFGMNPKSYIGQKIAHKGDYVICLRDLDGPLLAGISDYYGCLSPLYLTLQINNEVVESKYFDYIMRALDYTRLIDKYSYGMRHSYNFSQFANLQVKIPDLITQKKIVNILNEKIKLIDDILLENQNKMERLLKYKQSLITKYVYDFGNSKNDKVFNNDVNIPSSWDIIPLKYLFNFQKGLSITKEDLKDDGLNVISYGQIHAKYNKATTTVPELFRFVDKKYLNTGTNSLVDIDDFIFADTSEDLAGVGDFVRIDRDDTIFAGYHTIILKAKKPEYSHYFSYLFLTDAFRNQIRIQCNGVKLFSITMKILSKINLVLPDIGTANKICDFLDDKIKIVDDCLNLIKDENRCLEQLKKSFIFDYITGKKEV